jgi:hypothetical protein
MFYCDKRDAEYYHVGSSIFHRTESGIRKILEISSEDNPKNYECNIIFLLEFAQHRVLLLNWPVKRNIFCIDKNTDELIWRLPAPPDTWKGRTNYWSEIRADVNLYPDHVYCYTCDQYRCIYEVSTGKLVQEFYPNGGDPRDF